METSLTERPSYDLTLRLSNKERLALRALCNGALTHPAHVHFSAEAQAAASALYKALSLRKKVIVEDEETKPDPHTTNDAK